MKKIVVILAGGSGTRLWPLSTNAKPKQLLKLLSDKSLLRETFERMLLNFSIENIYISLNIDNLERAKDEIPELPESNFITEPVKMDTTAAIGLIAATINQTDPDALIYITQCDHYIPKPKELFKIQETAFAILEKHPDKIVAIGTNPNYAETSFGYIEMGEPVDRVNNQIIFSKASFKEKPDEKTAEKFIQSWKYLWNLGNYAFVAKSMLDEYKKLAPKTFSALNKYFMTDSPEKRRKIFSQCDKISIDYGISEKSENIFIIPGELRWIDVANWKTVYDIAGEKINHSVVAKVDAENNLVLSNKRVALLGVHNLAIVETDDALMICDLSRATELKKLVEQLPDELL